MSNSKKNNDEQTHAHDAAVPRKLRSEDRLKQLGAPADSSLPPLPEELTLLRSADLIAGRAMCLCLCASKAEGLEPEIARELLVDFNIGDNLTAAERAYLESDDPVEPETARLFQWGYEACWVLLWVLGYVQELPDPIATCDPERIAAFMTRHPSVEALSSGAVIRQGESILDAADFNRRVFQLCVRSGPPYQQVPGGFLAAVAYQREHAFQWLLTHKEAGWDEIVIDIGSNTDNTY